MKTVFSEIAWSDYTYWTRTDRAKVKRINGLIEACKRDPFEGVGKPEPLKGNLSGWWSRRIDTEHRLVYRVQGDAVEIAQARGHYDG